MLEVKKSPKADLEKYRTIWLLMGYVVALSLLLLALEWTGSNDGFKVKQVLSSFIAEDESVSDNIRQDSDKQVALASSDVSDELPEPVGLVALDDPELEEDVSLPYVEESHFKVEIRYIQTPVVEPEVEPTGNNLEKTVESMPEFPGGTAALMSYLAHNIKYPVIARENFTQGRVLVEFVVNRDGTITDARIAKSVDPALDKEALRVVNSMPRWKPGMQGSRPMRVSYTLPVTFRLQQ